MRFFGFGSSMRCTKSCASADTAFHVGPEKLYLAFRTLARMAESSRAANGGLPDSSMYVITPIDHMSTACV